MRVGMVEAELEDLLEVAADTLRDEVHTVHARHVLLLEPGGGHPVDERHGEHAARGVVPEDLREGDGLVVRERLPEPVHGAALVGVVQLRAQHVGELLREGRDVVVLAPLRVQGDLAAEVDEDLQVDLHGLGDAGALHLDGDGGAVRQRRPVDLPDAGGGDGRGVELDEELLDRRAQLLLDAGAHLLPGHGGHVVLQLGQLDGQVGRDEVATGGEDLAHLDEGRAEALESAADAHRPREVLLGDGLGPLRRRPPGRAPRAPSRGAR